MKVRWIHSSIAQSDHLVDQKEVIAQNAHPCGGKSFLDIYIHILDTFHIDVLIQAWLK